MEELSDLEKVQEALDVLDVDDQEHWTTEDLPRVDVVSGLSGVSDLTRETLTLMFPHFVRYPMVADTEESSVEDVEEEEPEEVLSRETMEGMIDELAERASAVSQDRSDLLIQVNELNYQADALRDKMQKNFPPPSAAEVQRRYAQMHVQRSMVASQQNAAVLAAAEKVMNAPS